MSPFFGKHRDADADASPSDERHQPRLVELGPVLDDAVKEAAATPWRHSPPR